MDILLDPFGILFRATPSRYRVSWVAFSFWRFTEIPEGFSKVLQGSPKDFRRIFEAFAEIALSLKYWILSCMATLWRFLCFDWNFENRVRFCQDSLWIADCLQGLLMEFSKILWIPWQFYWGSKAPILNSLYVSSFFFFFLNIYFGIDKEQPGFFSPPMILAPPTSLSLSLRPPTTWFGRDWIKISIPILGDSLRSAERLVCNGRRIAERLFEGGTGLSKQRETITESRKIRND